MALPRYSEKVGREIDEYALRVYKSDSHSPGFQRLPRCWNAKDRSRCLRLSHFALTVTYSGGFTERHDSNYSNHEPACVRADTPVPLTTGIYYFEITVAHKGNNGRSVSIGFSTKSASLAKLPGCEHSSFGYHNDGFVYHGSSTSTTKFGPRIVENDTVGCGVDFISRSLFFTRNGVFLGKAFEGKVPSSPGTRLYPSIGLQGRGARLSTNFGQRPFNYAFDAYIEKERALQETNLVERVCKEEFAGPKMRELVSGYLVHHGYVATAQAFSRWSSVSSDFCELRSSLAPPNTSSDPAKSSDAVSLSSRSSESHLLPNQSNLPDLGSAVGSLPRRHSDTSCISPQSSAVQLPGIASMLHRRRLRALCRRCQYGKAAATLNRLYPQVLERCPELLVQLRCRQLIEMMRRHAVRRGRSAAFDPASDLNGSNSTTVPPKVQKISDCRQARSGCCVTPNATKAEGLAKFSVCAGKPGSKIVQNGTSADAMDVDAEHHGPEHLLFSDENKESTDFDGESDVGDADDDEEDDDSFGMDEDAGLCINSPPALVSTNDRGSEQQTSVLANGMEVDNETNETSHITASTSNSLSAKQPTHTNNDQIDKDEMRCLLRHVQFGRSLVSLVKQVRAKTGGLSLETERLLQQSVSLLAYPSPTSPDCPLRGLLDPVWRDTIANIINSAVLKAHDLPVQPALEQGLRALQRCFQDQYFVEAQTLGHFLLYHMSPSQLEKAENSILSLESKAHERSSKVHHSGSESSENCLLNQNSKAGSSIARRMALNGHPDRRRSRRREQQTSEIEDGPDDGTLYDTEEGSSSSLEEVLNKEDEEDEDDDDDDGERCHLDDLEDNDDNDDDQDDGDAPASVGRSRRGRSSQGDRGGQTGGSNTSNNPSSNSGGSGRGSAGNVNSASLSSHLSGTLPDGISPRSRLGRQALFTRYCPAFILDSTPTRVLAAVSSPVPALRHLSASNRSAGVEPGSTIQNRSVPSDLSASPNQYLDSAFRGLLSMSCPHHAEFLAAMDDALKAYAGSLLTNEDVQSNSSSPSGRFHHRHHPGGPPPSAGDSACAP